MSFIVDPAEEMATALQRQLLAYLRSGQTDAGARAQLEALPGGAEMLARALAIKEDFARIRAPGGSVDEYLQWKQEEIEQERRRDEQRHAQCP